jgi:putative NADH-flavin reductase
MRLLIFGATGPTGRLVVDQALKAGHTVAACARRPESLNGQHERLNVHAGDVLDPAAVRSAVEGHEAVIAVYGVPLSPFKAITVYSEGTRNIVSAMESTGVSRYLGVTSGGTSPSPQPNSSFVFEWFIKPVIGGTHYRGQRRQEEIVMASSLRWTIVRPARLVNGPPSHRYVVQPGYVVSNVLNAVRADVAEFLVRAVGDPQWEHQAVAIATPGGK